MSQQLMFRDDTILTLSGVSQAALALNGNRQFLFVMNVGTANVGVNFVGPATSGTQTTTGIGNLAAIGGKGTAVIAPGDYILLDRVVPQNPVNVIGDTNQPLLVIEA